MARSKFKFLYFSRPIWKIIFLKKQKKTINKSIKIFSRSSAVPLSLISCQPAIHKGSVFKRLFIHKLIVGRKFGEFSFTRKPFFFVSKKKKR